MSAIPLDPLIAEAKERARRRRLVALVAAGLVAAGVAAAVTHPQRLPESSHWLGTPRSTSLGVCATTPDGWHKKTGWEFSLGPATLGLTNFRFGPLRADPDTYGLTSFAHRPRGSITIVLDSSGPADSTRHHFKRSLRVTRADFSSDPYGDLSWPTANIIARTHGVEQTAVVEVGSLTPATIAAANRALAGVRTCST